MPPLIGVIGCLFSLLVRMCVQWCCVYRFVDGCAIDGIHFVNKNGREGTSVMLVEGSNFTLTNCTMEDFFQVCALRRTLFIIL